MSDAAFLELALGALALRLRREIEVMRALRSPDRRDQFLGLVMGDQDAAMLCEEIAGRIGTGRDEGLDAAVAEAEAQVRAARDADPWLAISRLGAVFGLDPLEQDLLVLAAAPAIDPRFGLVYGFLADDMTRRALTPALAQRILADRGAGLVTLRAICEPRGRLMRHALLAPAGEGPLLASTLACDEHLIDLLMGRDCPDPALLGLAHAEDIDADTAAQYGLEPLGRDPVALAERPGDDPLLWALAAARGAGLGVLRLDWSAWSTLADAALPGQLSRALREARLAARAVLLRGWEAAPAWVRMRAAELADLAPLVVTGDAQGWIEAGLMAIGRDCEAPPADARAAAWREAIAGRAADPNLAAELGATFAIPFDQMCEVARQAAAAPADGFDEALREAARRRAGQSLKHLAERLPTAQGLEALVLPPQPLAALGDLISARATGVRVLNDWGFGEVYARRPGLVALFAGPPGTGKTMAAGVVAHTLDIDLYRIDLSAVVSKYIGETERNLERIFQAAEHATAVLFFDEADALFGKRSEVQDAHDRYANIEVSYLLQRIERFDGVAILATNLRQNLDGAFLRRIDFVIDFPMPQASDRLRLWRKLGETRAPLAEDIDLAVLAERYELSGGAIRNCAIAAAHAAAREEAAIAMRHLVSAVAREFIKQGQPLRKALFADLTAVPDDRRAGP